MRNGQRTANPRRGQRDFPERATPSRCSCAADSCPKFSKYSPPPLPRVAEWHLHGRLRAAPHAAVENEAESRPPEWCQSNFPVPEEQKLPNLGKGHTVSAPLPLQMRFCQRPIVHRLCAWRTAVSLGGSPRRRRAAGVSHVSRYGER